MTPIALLSILLAYIPRRDPPGFFQFLEGRNGSQPGDADTHPVIFWGVLTAIFLFNIGTVTWATLRRRARRKSKQTQKHDFKSYKPK
jgi:hypothetical protein